jgi:hypothetical protein
MEQVPPYVSVVFMITTFITVGIFLFAVRGTPASNAARVVTFTVPFWLILQFVLAGSGFYADTSALPPRLFAFGAGPAFAFIAALLVLARSSFISFLPLGLLTLVHVIRIPVELVLAWLADAGAVPHLMTFHGTNFDILSGLTAPVAYWLSRRDDASSRKLLLAWNFLTLGLVLNIVITAILCLPSPIQQFAFEQPNRAVLYAPYIWLPTVVVPIVFLSHFASIYKVLIGNRI